MHVVPPLPQSYASFEQQSTNLVDDCRATYHPALAHAMQGLHIQLVISLDQHETHRRPCDSLSDRLGIDVVALVRFHVRLHILRRNQSHLVSLFPQCSAKEMRTSAGFHTNQPDVYVGSEAQQLSARELLAHHDLAAQVKPDQMKDLSYQDQCRWCVVPWEASSTSYNRPVGSVKAADHPIINGANRVCRDYFRLARHIANKVSELAPASVTLAESYRL